MSILNIVEGFEAAAPSTGESLFEGEQMTFLGVVVDEVGAAVDVTGWTVAACCEPHRASVSETADTVHITALVADPTIPTRRFVSGDPDGVVRIHDGPAGLYLWTAVKDLWPEPVPSNPSQNVPDMVVIITLTSDGAPFPDIEIGRMHLIYRRGESTP